MEKSLLKLNHSKIKLLLLSLVIVQFISLQLIAQNSSSKHWFVNKNATGAGTGKTIENAWTSFAGIGWSSMADGDTLFISGGADSTFYYEQLNVGRGHITIMPSAITNHNGKVIIDAQGIRSYGVRNNTYPYVTIYGLNIRNATAANIQLRNSNCVLSHNTIYISSGATSGLDIRGSNNIIEYTTSSTSNKQNDGQRDFCQATTGGHHIFRYNTHYNYNPDPDSHTDFIQCYPPFDDVEVYSNYAIDVDEKRSNSNLLYLNGIGGVVKVYNNVIIDQSDSTVNGLITIKETTTATDLDTLLVYNNSLYSAGFGLAMNIDASVAGTPVYMAIYNNAIRGDVKAHAIYTSNGFIPLVVKSTTTPIIDNNIYWRGYPSGISLSYNGTGYTFTNWQGLGFDANGLNAQPSYTSITEGAFNLQSTVGGNLIGKGTIIKPNFGIEYGGSINRVNRLSNSWDIGAYQYSAGNTSSDNIAPNLSSVALINSTTLELNFSEELEIISAQTISNYNVNNGITIKSASLSSDKKKITLTTTQHSANQNYVVTVTRVKDIAGNIISLNNSAQYTFVENTTGNLKANVKVFLEGSYNGSSMTTALPDNEVMPDIQPYSAAPWNYNGSESFNAVPDLTVDWVLVELRSAENPAQVVSMRAGLLRSDGRIMEPDGTLGVTFKNILYGYYYIAVRHRNHLSVMSSSPVLFSPDNDLYDFTTSISKAYGPDGMAADTANGVFMMYSGDGNGNGIIDGDDYDGVWSEDNGNIGYLNGDFNLDSGVNSKDSREFWNNGKSTKVP